MTIREENGAAPGAEKHTWIIESENEYVDRREDFMISKVFPKIKEWFGAKQWDIAYNSVLGFVTEVFFQVDGMKYQGSVNRPLKKNFLTIIVEKV